MQPLLTSAETAALDRETEARGTPVEALMERAGLAVAHAAVGLAGGAYGRRAVVVAGKGNNGGDGLVAARHLAGWGMAPAVVLLADPGDLREPAASNLARLGRARVPVRQPEALSRELARADVAVDALFGTGFRGAAEGPHAAAIEALAAARCPVVAVDIPSGVEGDTGAVRGPAVAADVTVTFGAPKVGDVLLPGAGRAGVLVVADIGFPPDLVRAELAVVEASDVAAVLPPRPLEAHKRSAGVVLVVSGSRRMAGAPRLVARGAARAGAGLVTVATPEGIVGIVQSTLQEATFLPLPEGPEGAVAEAAWGPLADRLGSVHAVAVGPGLSTDDGAPALVRRLVEECPVPMVVDADALNAFAGRAADLGRRASEAVLTPHAGEFARLFGMPADEVNADRAGLARKAAAETRATVLLKGPTTVVASPDGEARVNPTGGPVLATGGTGDVLTGVTAAFLARGLSALDAATAAAYVHGSAGGIAGRGQGEGVVAGDVAEALPEAILRAVEGLG